jgi:hypothetical protein
LSFHFGLSPKHILITHFIHRLSLNSISNKSHWKPCCKTNGLSD